MFKLTSNMVSKSRQKEWTFRSQPSFSGYRTH